LNREHPINMSLEQKTTVFLEDSDSDDDLTVVAPKNRWFNTIKNFNQGSVHHRTRATKTYNVSILIDETYKGVDDIEGLKTSLFPHQKPIVQAMLDVENIRKSQVTMTSNGYGHTATEVTIMNSSCVLSEPVGSGKTIDVLSLILLQKFPKAYPDIGVVKLNENSNTKSLKSVVRRKFKNILFPTIIFAGVSVVDQWVQAIKEFTSLRYFAVYHVRDLQILIEMMASKKINNYDIVVVKNGKITRPVKFPDFVKVELKNKKSNPYIYNVISNIRNFCWSRVVVDDFDTIKLPHNAGLVNGLFTWYISSTKKMMPSRVTKNSQFRTTSDMLMYSNYGCGKIMENKLLFNCMNIRNNPEFIEQTNNLPSPKFFAYVFNNPNDRYMGLMGVMDNEQANQIMEMLNGDAFETAADAAGIKSTSVADIFQKILGEQFENYETSIKVIDFIDRNEDAKKRIPYSENPDTEDTYTKKNLLEYRHPSYNYPGLRGLLSNTKVEYKEIHEKSGIAIQRVKSNISEGDCPICYIDLKDEEEDCVILKCCGVVVCSGCCFETIFPNKRMDGQCSNCRARLSILNIIYLNSEFNLDSIVEDRIQDNFSGDLNVETEPNEAPKKPRTKIDAIVDIINGVSPEEQKAVDVRIHNLMKGRGNLPNGEVKKVLIFANYDETLKKLEEEFIELKIKYVRLGGGHSEISRKALAFQKSKKSCVMIINSTKHCSGINLQTATDLIFSHKILDKNVEAQVAGRIQRMGRKTQANIHYMFYKNEYKHMIYGNQIREL
jgi:SNF2 family DNA or RNA helicase